MKTLAKTVAAVAIVAASVGSAQAFWGGSPWSSWSNGSAPWSTWTEMFGDVDANFSSRGWGRGSGYGYPQYGYGYGPHYGGGYPYFGGPVVAPVAVAPVVTQAK